jgi:ferredoxin
MKATIDREQCIACSVCWSECPALFEEDPADGKSSITAKYRVGGDASAGEAPEELRASAEAAASGCPVGIIKIE